jgi:2'-5' RNA ligase
MRTFIAIEIPVLPSLEMLYSDLLQNLTGLKIKYTDINTFHLTLAFLGETTINQSKAIINHLNQIKVTHNSFNIELIGLGQFGNQSSPQIIWVGIQNSDPLTSLWNQVNSCIKLEKFEPDPRGFSPHLTLGRVKFAKSNHNLQTFIDKYGKSRIGTLQITEFVFYESILHPTGPIYNKLATFNLGNA